VTGVFFIIGGLVQMETAFLGGTTPASINTVFFAAFVIAAVWNGINCRALDGKMPPFFKGNPMFFVVMGFIVLTQILIVQYGGLVFGTVPLSLYEWVKLIAMSASVLVVGFVIRVAFHQYRGLLHPESRSLAAEKLLTVLHIFQEFSHKP